MDLATILLLVLTFAVVFVAANSGDSPDGSD